ncbi:HutD/Ves family protein [Hwanghaeella sp.]|uniref:HutD/Ves family protein n=1 Tax=Hwanghaeella sp. TaxID=2605943 RepID=UPI003CCBAF43
MPDRSENVRYIPLSQQTEMPWKNGGGTTREICKHQDASGVVWRASIATIHASGPFSLFEGCDRIITLIDGPPVMLNFADGEQRTLEIFTPEHFSCDRPVSATIAATSHDLNLIWRRDSVSVASQAINVQGPTEITLAPADWHLIVACDGSIEIAVDGNTSSLSAGEAMLFNELTEMVDLTLKPASGTCSVLAFRIFRLD